MGAVLFVMTAAMPAYAHHSAAAFDREHPYTMVGTIKEMNWANPHIWITVLVPDDNGGMDEYSLEGPGVCPDLPETAGTASH